MTIPLIHKKIGRRLRSASGWPLQLVKKFYFSAIAFICSAMTDRYWLLDYVPSRKTHARTVLIVRFDLIGDFVLWLDAAKELKKIYPSCYLVLYANSVWSAMAAQLPYWDEVVAVDVPRLRTDFRYRLRIFLKIRNQSFDIGLQPTFSREYIGDLAIRASSAKQRIGHLGDLNNITAHDKRITDTWYTRLIDISNLTTPMELETNAYFISSLGQDQYVSSVPKLPVLCALPSKLKIDNPYIVIVPGASWEARAWPIEYFAELINGLGKGNSKTFVLCGALNEWALCENLRTLCPNSDIQNLAGQTALVQLIEIIRSAELTIANESAAIHIAAATETPSVCITGGGHYGRFMPYGVTGSSRQMTPVAISYQMDCFGCKWICPFKTPDEISVPCILKITVVDVLKKCEALLDSRASQGLNEY